MSVDARAAAADIAVALLTESGLTTARVEEVGMAAGHTRAATRAGLAWGLERGLFRRGYGRRTTLIFSLADPSSGSRLSSDELAVPHSGGDHLGVSGA